MFNPKVSKSQDADKTPYTLYNPNWIENVNIDFNWPDRIRVISIDPGIQNFCIRIEERPYKYNKDNSIKMILYDKLKLTRDEIGLNECKLSKHYNLLYMFFDKHKDILKSCHICIIERQLAINPKACRIAQHTISYMLILGKNNPNNLLIFEIDSKLKTKECKDKHETLKKDTDIKKWSIDFATELLDDRNDQKSLKILQKSKKKDDYADTVTQIEAFFKHMKYPTQRHLELYESFNNI